MRDYLEGGVWEGAEGGEWGGSNCYSHKLLFTHLCRASETAELWKSYILVLNLVIQFAWWPLEELPLDMQLVRFNQPSTAFLYWHDLCSFISNMTPFNTRYPAVPATGRCVQNYLWNKIASQYVVLTCWSLSLFSFCLLPSERWCPAPTLSPPLTCSPADNTNSHFIVELVYTSTQPQNSIPLMWKE